MVNKARGKNAEIKDGTAGPPKTPASTPVEQPVVESSPSSGVERRATAQAAVASQATLAAQ